VWRAEPRVIPDYEGDDEASIQPRTMGTEAHWIVEEQSPVERSVLSMEFQDKALTCMDCGNDFVFTAGEQLFFHDKQFKNEPKRCKYCKAKRAATFGPNGQSTTPVYNKVETRTICSHCNKETTVPFRPTQGRPVLCRECFQQGRVGAAAV
jgi:CxxC-x17-CxxC domain-containing protein